LSIETGRLHLLELCQSGWGIRVSGSAFRKALRDRWIGASDERAISGRGLLECEKNLIRPAVGTTAIVARMPDPFDFDNLRALISKSRRLKKDAVRMNTEAILLDSKIEEALTALRSDATSAELDQLQAEAEAVEGPGTSNSNNGSAPKNGIPGAEIPQNLDREITPTEAIQE